MDVRAAALGDILRLNTRLFRNCLEGMSDAQAHLRPSATTNHAAFVAAHLVDSRFFLLRLLGATQANPLSAYLEGARKLDDVARWPTLEEIHAAWSAASAALRDRLQSVTPEELDGPPASKFPAAGTMRDAVIFMVQHDSYHVGQLSLLRSHAGLPAMSYQ
jgi:uncharacterized damage-inducible protein DinB